MKNKKKWGTLFAAILILITALVWIGIGPSSAENPNWSKTVFYVS